VRNNVTVLPCDEILFVKVVKTAFNQRRKMLRNSIREICEPIPDEFAELRPEQLTVDAFIRLTSAIEKLQKEKKHGS
jgi:16S rRNA (adenine1518-N6/adenine1519-N6)-dimethyltransferase